jgi:hypothetical protein
MNFAIHLAVGFLSGLIVNAIQEKSKSFGYGKVAFNLGSKTLGYDDVLGIAIGVALMFWKESRTIGIGITSAMIYTKIAEGTSLPTLDL